MNINIGPKISLDGEADFRTSIKNSAAAIKALDAELEASKQQFKENATSTEALTSKNELLKNKSDILSQRLAVLKKEYDNVAAAQGENSTKALNLRAEIAKNETQFYKLKNEIADTRKELDGVGDSMDDAGKKSVDFSEKASPAFDKAKTAALTTTAAITGITAALAKLSFDVAASVDELNTLSTTSGVSAQQLQQLEYASKFVDVSVDTMTKSIKEVGKQMGEALKNPSGDAAQAFKSLGVSITGSSGQLRDSQTVWEEVLIRLGNVASETERTNLAMKLMSEEANLLNGIMGADGVSALNRFTAEAQNSGYVMSNTTLNSLQKLNDEYDRAKLQIESTKNEIAAELAPELTNLARTFTIVVKAATPFIVDSLEWILNHGPEIARVIGLVVGGLIGFKIASTLTQLMAAFNGTMAVTNATMLANPAVWIAAAIAVAVAALAASLYMFASNSAKAVESAGSIGQEIEEGIKEAETAVEAFNDGVTDVVEKMDWGKLKQVLTSNFTKLADASAESFSNELAKKLKNIDSVVSQSMPKTFSVDVETSISNLSQINSSLINSQGFSGSNMMTDFVNALKSVLGTLDFHSGKLNAARIQMVVDGRTLAEVLWDPFNDVALQKGVEIINVET